MQPTLKSAIRILASFAVFLCVAVAVYAQKPSAGKVTITDDGTAYTLSNGIIDARIEKRSGDIVSLKYKGTEVTGTLPNQGPGRENGYWSPLCPCI